MRPNKNNERVGERLAYKTYKYLTLSGQFPMDDLFPGNNIIAATIVHDHFFLYPL